MKLYHFTCVEHLASIQRDDLIITTESNVSFEREHAGPDVVWLSSDPGRPPRDSWTHGSYYDKTRIRITVDVPDAVKWAELKRLTTEKKHHTDDDFDASAPTHAERFPWNYESGMPPSERLRPSAIDELLE
jgi:hypothetical protein